MSDNHPEDISPIAGDARLDFTSPQFDAAAALQQPDLEPPVPDAPVLDNVSKCVALVPGLAEEAPAARVASEESKAKAAALKRRAQKAAERAEASVTTGSLASIMALAASGPLAALAQWQAAGQRVLVVTRHAAGVRGRAVGTLTAFDRYMNLLLTDVEESYTVIVKVQRVKQQLQPQPQRQGQQEQQEQGPQLQEPQQQGPQLQEQSAQQQLQQRLGQEGQLQEASSLPPDPGQASQAEQQQPALQQQQQAAGRTRLRWCRKQEHRFRRLGQVLLKGDNVVLVSNCGLLPAARPAAAALPQTAHPG